MPLNTGCTFQNNTAAAGGGAFAILDKSEVNFTDCVISDNRAVLDGAGRA